MKATSHQVNKEASRPRSGVPQPIESATLPHALLRIRTVVAMTGLSTATIYRKLIDRTFPQPVRLGLRCTRWRCEDVRLWVAALTPDK